MSSVKAKTINLLLYEGNLGGVISIEDSSWNSGELYSAPRESVEDLLSTDACKKFGVYLLLSQEMVYIGQSSDLSKRITQHTSGKDWWKQVVILTTKDDSLNHSDIDFLEYNLIEMAQNINRLDCDNKKKGNVPKVDKFRKVVLQQYMEEALFLMQLIGINVFNSMSMNEKDDANLLDIMDIKNRLLIGKGAKTDAKDYLESKGIKLSKYTTYAAIQHSRNEFWANPRIDLLSEEWDMILNNNLERELILVHIPSNTLSISDGESCGLMVRGKPSHLIDLNINVNTLIDKKSKVNFTNFVVDRIKY